MKPNGRADAKYRIAVPCYGNRVLPRFGVARNFFFADVDLACRTMHGLKRLSWEPGAYPELVRWLKIERVDGVLCGGIHHHFQAALYAGGLWVVWGFRGEVEEILHRWIQKADPREPAAGFQASPGQGCSRFTGLPSGRCSDR